MPTYEYKREDGSVFEKMQGINDKPLTECPETGQKVKRIISGGGGVVLKGSGWYVTDYKNKDNGASKSEEKNTDKKGKESEKTDTKDSAKAEK